ncbi:beta-eliminating lyase-related protein [Pseudomonas sp. RIT-PI-S]|uniref:threonine aldolase family protein n=1 Tax=Pseudomonas sp. RIT-PI-S TaxID=3035295 RepID=UPI0021DB5C6F|nr:beta-eliminating lyase-related protein [Pseudomonas sp. RIT-PI-S]
MAQWARANEVNHDRYGSGALINDFEAKVAEVLGKASALFLPSGVMAQLIALQIWAERRRLPRIGLHATSHLLIHEEQAYQALFQLQAVTVGNRLRPILASDLLAIAEPLSCLVTELPAREIGGQLPDWDELQALKSAAKDTDTPLHMDGARLWETRAFYQRSYAQIAEGFASVYVSAYKGLGGIAGALLAGDADFIEQARVWRRRLGGTLIKQGPMVMSAAMGFDRRLAMLEACYQRALSAAGCLSTICGIRVLPRIPQVNMFHLYIDADRQTLLEARDQIARQEGYWLFNDVQACDVPGWSKTEYYVGDRLLAVSDEQLTALFRRLMGLVKEPPTHGTVGADLSANTP